MNIVQNVYLQDNGRHFLSCTRGLQRVIYYYGIPFSIKQLIREGIQTKEMGCVPAVRGCITLFTNHYSHLTPLLHTDSWREGKLVCSLQGTSALSFKRRWRRLHLATDTSARWNSRICFRVRKRNRSCKNKLNFLRLHGNRRTHWIRSQMQALLTIEQLLDRSRFTPTPEH